MKTFKIVVLTMLCTIGIVGGIGLAVLQNFVSVTKESKTHTRVVIEDGVTTSDETWVETLGYNVKLNIQEETYIKR